MIIQSIKQELKYHFFSRNFFLFILILLSMIVITFTTNYFAIKMDYSDYYQTIQHYQEEDINIEDRLLQGYTIDDQQDGVSIENPLPYYKSQMEKNLYAMSHFYSPSQVLHVLSTLSSLIFVAIGTFIACNDYKYRTIKVKTVRMNKRTINMSKQITLMLITAILILLSVLLAYLVGFIFFQIIMHNFNMDGLTWMEMDQKSILPVKILFTFLIAVFYAEMGYCLGLLFKSSLIPILIFATRSMLIPTLDPLDPQNIQLFFANKVFDFYGIALESFPLEVAMIPALAVMLGIFVLAASINDVVFCKRSSFY